MFQGATAADEARYERIHGQAHARAQIDRLCLTVGRLTMWDDLFGEDIGMDNAADRIARLAELVCDGDKDKEELGQEQSSQQQQIKQQQQQQQQIKQQTKQQQQQQSPSSSKSQSPSQQQQAFVQSCDRLLRMLRTPAAVVQPLMAPPSWLARHWLWLAAAGVFSLRVLYARAELSSKLRALVSEGVETASRFVESYLLLPLKKIFLTVRYDRHELFVQSARSFESDMESLQRMVAEWARRSLHMSAASLGALRQQVAEGDLTLLMKSYEDELQHPVANLVGGNLVQLMLIQIQKSKCDIELAMAALDKIIRSNELTFQLLSTIPAVALLLWLLSWRHSARSTPSAAVVRAAKHHMIDLAQAINIGASARTEVEEARTEGKITVHCHLLDQLVSGCMYDLFVAYFICSVCWPTLFQRRKSLSVNRCVCVCAVSRVLRLFQLFLPTHSLY